MHIRLGIIGPEDSIALLRNVCQEFNGDFSIMEKSYVDFEDLQDLSTLAKDVDVMLFSGQAPYFWAKSHLGLDVPSIYIPRNGTCLYKALFDIYRDGIDISSLSFDTINRKDIEETYRELAIPLAEVLTIDYEKYLPYDKLINYHFQLWHEGKTKAAVTCLTKPYEELKKLGVPTYRIYPTSSIIRQKLEKAIMCGEHIKLKEIQMALLMVRVEDIDDVLFENSSYQLKIQLLELHQIILEYADETNATVVKTGDTEFMIFTTRGCLEESTNIFEGSPLLKAIKENSPLKVTIGIGFGRTAKMAEASARQALRLSKESGGDSCFVVTEEGKITGPLKEDKSQPLTPWDLSLEQMAQKLNMNVLNLMKLKSSLRRLSKNTITPKELSTCMNISQRSARRILSQLEEKGAAKIIGIKSLSGKGRPRQVYEVFI